MNGWKTYISALIIGGCAAAMYLGWIDTNMRDVILTAGQAGEVV